MRTFFGLAAPLMALFVMGAAAGPAAADPDLAGARAFVRNLYSHYPTPADGEPFYPAGPAAPRVFDPSLVEIIRQGQRHSGGTVWPGLDADPLCDCQDDEGMTSTLMSVRATGQGRAIARVLVRFGRESHVVRLDLVAVGREWRVRDVVSRGTSWRQVLEEANHAGPAGRPG